MAQVLHYSIVMNTTTKTRSLSIRTAGDRARKLLGSKASPSDVGRLGAELIRISKMDISADSKIAIELMALDTAGR